MYIDEKKKPIQCTDRFDQNIDNRIGQGQTMMMINE